MSLSLKKLGVTFATLALSLLSLSTVSQAQWRPIRKLDRIQVDPVTQRFVDSKGNAVLFHGTNSVKKSWPFYSEFTDEELDMYAYEWGYNIIRLGITWEALEPTRGNYNDTYIQKTIELIDRFAERGVYTLVDMHQDLYGPKICGNGFPDWSVVIDPVVATKFAFPMPLLGYETFEYGPDGRITSADCGKLPFWSYIYFTFVTGSAFESLYDDAQGIQTAFINAWTYLASKLEGRTSIVGHELINEPWPGRVYREPGLLIKPGYADEKFLVPMYDRLHDSIRKVDNTTIIFYEAHVSTTNVVPYPVGFERGPGGSEYSNRHAFAFHLYCPTADSNLIPTNEKYCDFYARKSFEVREKDYRKLGGGVILSEFGVYGNNDIAVEELRTMTGLCDKYLMSWTHWEFGAIVHLQLDKVLTDTYAMKTAGNPTFMKFDNTTSTFELTYDSHGNDSQTTDIYLHEKVWYPNGFSVDIQPAGVANWKKVQENFVSITHLSGKVSKNAQISVVIKKL